MAPLIHAYSRLGQSDTARALYQEFRAGAKSEQTLWIAAAAAGAGEIDEGMELAFLAVEEHDPMLWAAARITDWRPLRDHLRFSEFLVKGRIGER